MPEEKLTVAVTGPTGEIGKPFIAALERSESVASIRGMARRPFDPADHGWEKVEYRQGDILDRGAVEELVAGADVVVHLAFVIVAGQGKSREINLTGSRNVFEAAVAAKARRLVYTSSVAAYGFDRGLPPLLTEEVEAVGAERHPYSAQKAEVEAVLAEALAGSKTEAYVFRPCVVAGPQAPLLVESVPMSGIAATSRARCVRSSIASRPCARSCPTPASASSWSTTTTSPRPSSPGSSGRARRASTTSRARAS